MIKFSIFLPTYNRQALVINTIDSILAQSYENFEILLYDNGSEPSVQELAESYDDVRILYIRCASNRNVCDLAEDALDRMSGTHFLFIADDDVLVPSALEIVAGVFNAGDAHIVQTALAHFNYQNGSCALNNDGAPYSGRLVKYAAPDVAFNCITSWGIGELKNYCAPRSSHSSGIFLSKELIERTRSQQKELFIKPFGDIGYVGALLNTDYCHYIDLPLAIIGAATVREMNGAKPGQRQKWNREVQFLEHSPLKAASFINMGADAHLKVLYRNRRNDRNNARLRPDFYLRHLKQVLSDSPWTSATVKDVLESLPHALVSLWHFFSLRYFFAERLINKLRPSVAARRGTNKARNIEGATILDCAAAIQQSVIEPLLNQQEDTADNRHEAAI